MFSTIEGVSLSDKEIMNKLLEEVIELSIAIKEKSNISEEVFDVIQMCFNIAAKYNIRIEESEINHLDKLINRGYRFILKGEDLMTSDKLLKLIGDNPGKLKRLYTQQQGEFVITVYEICGIKFAIRL